MLPLCFGGFQEQGLWKAGTHSALLTFKATLMTPQRHYAWLAKFLPTLGPGPKLRHSKSIEARPPDASDCSEMVALAEVSSRAAVSEVWFSTRLVLGDTQKLSSATRMSLQTPPCTYWYA